MGAQLPFGAWLRRGLTIMQYIVAILLGYLKEVVWGSGPANSVPGQAPLFSGFDSFYQRRLYPHCAECFGIRVLSAASKKIDIVDPRSGAVLTGIYNLGSYKYVLAKCRARVSTHQLQFRHFWSTLMIILSCLICPLLTAISGLEPPRLLTTLVLNLRWPHCTPLAWRLHRRDRAWAAR